MNKEETKNSIYDFVQFNLDDIDFLRANNPAAFSAFSGLLNAVSSKYGSGETVLNPSIIEVKTAAKKDKSVRKPKEEGVLISELPTSLCILAWRNQLLQGNPVGYQINLGASEAAGGFDWDYTGEGRAFWENISAGYFDEAMQRTELFQTNSYVPPNDAETTLLLNQWEKSKRLVKNLPYPIQQLAITNANVQTTDFDLTEEKIRGQKLGAAFNFVKSNEGLQFWEAVSMGNFKVPYEYAVQTPLNQQIAAQKAKTKKKGVEDFIFSIVARTGGKVQFIQGFDNFEDAKKQLRALEVGAIKSDIYTKGQYTIMSADGSIISITPNPVIQPSDPTQPPQLKSAILPSSGVYVDYSTWTPDWRAKGNRPSPTRSAAAGTIGEVGVGNDGDLFQIEADKNGVQRWKRLKQSPIDYLNAKGSKLPQADLGMLMDIYQSAKADFDKDDDEYKELTAVQKVILKAMQ